MGQEIKNPDLSGKIRKKAEIPKKSSGSLTLGIFKIWTIFIFEPKFRRKIPKMKIKNKNLKKKKKKKFIFFFGQEIKNRRNPQKSGENRKSSQKIFHFLKDFHSLTPAGVPFPLEQSLILNKSRSQALCLQCLSAHLRG